MTVHENAIPIETPFGRTPFGILQMGLSENMGPEYSTLNSRILIIRTPK